MPLSVKDVSISGRMLLQPCDRELSKSWSLAKPLATYQSKCGSMQNFSNTASTSGSVPTSFAASKAIRLPIASTRGLHRGRIPWLNGLPRCAEYPPMAATFPVARSRSANSRLANGLFGCLVSGMSYLFPSSSETRPRVCQSRVLHFSSDTHVCLEPSNLPPR